MEDFMWVLAAAFLVLIAMFFVSFLAVPGDLSEDLISVDTMFIGAVGRISNEPVTKIKFGSFNVGETQTELLKSVPQMRIYTSFIGSESKKYEINVKPELLQLMKDITINFDLVEGNKYGDLVIKWNGAEFLRKKASTKSYTITIAKEYVREINNLEIYAEGPGIMFWASTTYIINDFDIDLNYGPSKIFTFQLSQDDLEAWSRGKVSYYATGTSGKSSSELIIKVNGYEIHSEKPDGPRTIQFQYSDAPINIGDNLITFSSRDDMIILHNTELSIYLSTTELSKTVYFDINNDEYNLVQSGNYRAKLRFNINDIMTGGILDIDVNNHRKTIKAMTIGANNLYLTKTDINLGNNMLKFSGTGSWYIDKVIVELEKVEQ